MEFNDSFNCAPNFEVLESKAIHSSDFVVFSPRRDSLE